MASTPTIGLSHQAPRNRLGPAQHVDKQVSRVCLLPPEILSDILLLSMLPLDESVWNSPATSTCKVWRESAINTSRIWSCIRFAYNSAKERNICWLERAGSAPLHLFIKANPPKDTFDSSRHAHRIHTLTIPAGTSNTGSIFPLPFDASHLRELDVAIVPAKLSEIFHLGLPRRLTCLRLRFGCLSGQQFTLGDIDLSHLKELHTSDEISTSDVIQILHTASDLQILEWSSLWPVSDEAWPDEIPHLRRLYLREPSRIKAMTQISMPSLSYLRLTFLSTTPKEESDICMSLRSFPTLTHLALLVSVSITADDVLIILHSLPNLEYFEVPWHDGNMHGILALCGTPPPPLGGTNPSGKNSTPSSRAWACPKMRRCYLGVCDSMFAGTLSWKTAAPCITTLLTRRGATHTTASDCEGMPFHSLSPFVVVLDVKNPGWLPRSPDGSSALPPNSLEYLPFYKFPSLG